MAPYEHHCAVPVTYDGRLGTFGIGETFARIYTACGNFIDTEKADFVFRIKKTTQRGTLHCEGLSDQNPSNCTSQYAIDNVNYVIAGAEQCTSNTITRFADNLRDLAWSNVLNDLDAGAVDEIISQESYQLVREDFNARDPIPSDERSALDNAVVFDQR